MVNREDKFSRSPAQTKCILIERVQVKTFGILGDYRQLKPKTPLAKVKVQHRWTRVFGFCQIKISDEMINQLIVLIESVCR